MISSKNSFERWLYGLHGMCLTRQDILKSAAILLMVIDHIGLFFFPDATWIRVIGRLCIPIWFFFVGYSASQTLSPALLATTAMVVGVSAALHAAVLPMNILVTIVIYRLVNKIYVVPALKKSPSLSACITMLLAVLLWHPLAMFGWQYGMLAFPFSFYGTFLRQEIRDIRAMACVAAGTMIFIWLQVVHFSFTTLETVVMTAGVIGVVVMLWYYTPGTYDLSSHKGERIMQKILMFLGRHSLAFYAIHWLILIAIDQQMHPDRYASFRLLR